MPSEWIAFGCLWFVSLVEDSGSMITTITELWPAVGGVSP